MNSLIKKRKADKDWLSKTGLEISQKAMLEQVPKCFYGLKRHDNRRNKQTKIKFVNMEKYFRKNTGRKYLAVFEEKREEQSKSDRTLQQSTTESW